MENPTVSRRPDATEIGLIALVYGFRFVRWWPPVRWFMLFDEHVSVSTIRSGKFVVPLAVYEAAASGWWLKEIKTAKVAVGE